MDGLSPRAQAIIQALQSQRNFHADQVCDLQAHLSAANETNELQAQLIREITAQVNAEADASEILTNLKVLLKA